MQVWPILKMESLGGFIYPIWTGPFPTLKDRGEEGGGQNGSSPSYGSCLPQIREKS